MSIDPFYTAAVRSLSSSPAKHRSHAHGSHAVQQPKDSKLLADYSTPLEQNIGHFVEARLNYWERVNKNMFLYLTGTTITITTIMATSTSFAFYKFRLVVHESNAIDTD